MTKEFFRIALFATAALLCSTAMVKTTTSEKFAAIPTLKILA